MSQSQHVPIADEQYSSIKASCADLIGSINGFANEYGEQLLHVLPLPPQAAADLASILTRCRRLSDLLEAGNS
jgi:hypothetical protein